MLVLTNNEAQRDWEKGFTLIELLVVVALMAFVLSVSIASFSSFNKSQALQTGQLGVVNMLQQAKSEAESQVNPCSSLSPAESLQGYQVIIATTTTYELDYVCTTTIAKVTSKTLPTAISFTTPPQTIPQTIYFFKIQHGLGIANTITLQGTSGTQTITVDQLGNIQYSH